jgi:hypothetical protein
MVAVEAVSPPSSAMGERMAKVCLFGKAHL